MDTSQNAIIKRASLRAQQQANALDAEILRQLTAIYRTVLVDIQAQINNSAGFDGVVGINNMRSLLENVTFQLDVLAGQQAALINSGMMQNAEIAARVFSSIVDEPMILNITSDAVRTAQNFISEDGLQLSDRIWRLEAQARQKMGLAIQSAIIQGQSASQAAQDFVNRGLRIPGNLTSKINTANASTIGRTTANELMRNPDSVYANAKRVFRTEINRAHITAYQASLVDVPGVVGTQFLLSRNHPKVDICDLHAKANLYGLGLGVYPLGKSPLPAHPNTLSYEVAVFDDEVTSDDRKNKQTRSEWLAEQSAGRQAEILNSRGKQKAFDAGLLPENAFTTTWKIVKKRLEKKGVNIADLVAGKP